MGFLRTTLAIIPSITAQAGAFALTGQSATLTPSTGSVSTDVNTPIIAQTSIVSDPSPEFVIYGNWQAGDDLQFERQVWGNDWSAATVINHTVTAGEISGTAINFSLSNLAAGRYQYRCKYKHSGGSYSAYSPYESGDVDFTLVLTFLSKIQWTGPGAPSHAADAVIQIGAQYPSRRLCVFGCFADAGATVASVKINGSTAGVTLTQGGTGKDLYWMATALVPTGTTATFEITHSIGVFNAGYASVYSVDNSLLSSITPVSTHLPVAPGGAISGTLSLPTLAGGVAVTYGTVFAGTNTNLAITASSDSFGEFDDVSNIARSYSAQGTLARTSSITWGWANNSSEVYLTAWSLR
jgi:hypothetical protein